jgi:hypothetical protein
MFLVAVFSNTNTACGFNPSLVLTYDVAITLLLLLLLLSGPVLKLEPGLWLGVKVGVVVTVLLTW